MSVSNVPMVVAACCVLHNFCEIHGEAFDDAWLDEPQSLLLEELSSSTQGSNGQCSSVFADAEDVRNALVDLVDTCVRIYTIC